MKRLYSLLLSIILTLTYAATARDFTYTYEGQTLTYTVIDEDAKTCKTREGDKLISGNIVSEDLVIPEKAFDDLGESYYVIEIGSYSLQYNSSLTTVEIPNSVKSIGIRAFYDCTSLTSVTLSMKITDIGSAAFQYCKALTSIKMPTALTYLSNDLFSHCEALVSITLPESLTSIGEYSFYDCRTLSSIQIPSSVSSIDNFAFSGCSALTSVEIPSSISYIGHSAFESCSSLTSIEIPSSITSINESTFSGCSELASIIIPKSVAEIKENVFEGCRKLEKVYAESLESWMNIDFENEWANPLYYGAELIVDGKKADVIEVPDYTEEVKEFAFAGSKNIVEAVIPQSVKSIGDNAFQGCTSLESVKIGRIIDQSSRADNTTSIPNCAIGANTFSGCESLDFVAIGTNVSSIGERAFGRCGNLTRVDCYAITAPEAAANSFDDKTLKGATLHVPTGYKDVYEADAVWSRFGTIIDDLAVAEEAKPSGIEGVDGDGVPAVRAESGEILIGGDGVAEVYSLTGSRVAVANGGRVSGLPRGIYLVRTDGKTYKVVL